MSLTARSRSLLPRRGAHAALLVMLVLLMLWSRSQRQPSAAQPAGGASAGAPAGLSAQDWQGIRAQLPARSMAQIYLKAANVGAGDYFGYAVAIDGDTLVVGAMDEASNGSGPADNSAQYAGAAYVFVRTNGTWTQQAYLKASNVEAGEYFGGSVAIAGETIVVGASGEDSNGSGPADNSAENAGAAYVFVRTNGTWTQQAYLKAANAETMDQFGADVAIAGETIVVSAPWEASNGSSPANNSAEYAGAAYVFVRTSGTWGQQAYLKAATPEYRDTFGSNVAIAGETIVVGVSGEDSGTSSPADNSAPDAGAAYVFIRAGTTWSQQAYLKAANLDAGDAFGHSVAIAGETIVVGAHLERSGSGNPADDSAVAAGAAYVFIRSAAAQRAPGAPAWNQQAYLKATNAEANDEFGWAVAIAGDAVVVGASRESSNGSSPADNSAQYAGAAYVFGRTNGTWSQQAYLKATNADAADRFGHSVAITNGLVVSGAYGESSDGSSPANNSAGSAGAVYVMDLQLDPIATATPGTPTATPITPTVTGTVPTPTATATPGTPTATPVTPTVTPPLHAVYLPLIVR